MHCSAHVAQQHVLTKCAAETRLVASTHPLVSAHHNPAALLVRAPAHAAITSSMLSQRHISPGVACAAGSTAAADTETFQKLEDTQVWLVSEQRQVPITDLWGQDDRAFLVFARSMGCNFCQELARDLQRNVLPKFQSAGIKLFLISMGPPERGLEFAELTGFPSTKLLADPENVTYDKLELKNTGPIFTFFDPRTPLTLFKRLRKDGLKGAREALSNWKPWIPTKKGQGGAFYFEGKELKWQRYDEATGDHVDWEKLLEVAGV